MIVDDHVHVGSQWKAEPPAFPVLVSPFLPIEAAAMSSPLPAEGEDVRIPSLSLLVEVNFAD